MFRLLVLAVVVGSAWTGAVPRGLEPVRDSRIIGGEDATIERYPYQVSLRHLGAFWCGASLVRPNFVLTSAHCVYEANILLLKIVAGTSFRNQGGITLAAKEIILHEGFDPEAHRNDVAVVKLDGYFEYSDTVQAVTLASTGEIFRTGTKATVTGWGLEDPEAHFLPFQMRYADVFAVDFAKCVASYTHLNPVVDGMICAGIPGGWKDPCQGDAGGPLVVGRKQIGIVSWGEGCAHGDYPRVYSDVAFFRSWIESKLLS